MCRLYGLHANKETTVQYSLVHAQNALLRQSQSDVLGRSHANGWGVAYYENSHPTVVRREFAAFEDCHFSHTAERIYTRTIVAHVRLATIGNAQVENAHPFHYQSGAFAHNRTVREFDTVQGWMLERAESWLQKSRGGTTYSEHIFQYLQYLLSRIHRHGPGLEQRLFDPHMLIDIVADSVDTIAGWGEQAGADQPTKLNFVLTNGHVMVATRFNHTLYYVQREGLRDCELYDIPHVHHDKYIDNLAAIVASEQITHEDWATVPNGGLVFIDKDSRLHEYQMAEIIDRPLCGLVAEETVPCH